MDLKVEDINGLSDEQLFTSLKKCNLTVGPITSTTRRLYEKRLRTFLETGKLSDTTLNQTTTVLAETINQTVPAAPKVTKSTIVVSESIVTSSTSQPSPVRSNSKQRLDERADQRISSAASSTSTSSSSRALDADFEKENVKFVHPDTVLSGSSQFIRPAPVISSLSSTASSLTSASSSALPSSFATPSHDKFERASRLPDWSRSATTSSSLPAKYCNPSPSPATKDKFAERLNNYGLLRNSNESNPVIESLTSVNTNLFKGVSTNASMATPVRQRMPAASASYDSKPMEPVRKQPETAIKQSTDSEASSLSSSFNWKYLLMVCVATIIVYFIIISLQSNPKNPVEL